MPYFSQTKGTQIRLLLARSFAHPQHRGARERRLQRRRQLRRARGRRTHDELHRRRPGRRRRRSDQQAPVEQSHLVMVDVYSLPACVPCLLLV